MNNLKKYSIVTMILLALSVLALIMSHLALTDIYKGEGNLTLEWSVLRIAAIIFVAFIISTVFTLKQVFKTLVNNKQLIIR